MLRKQPTDRMEAISKIRLLDGGNQQRNVFDREGATMSKPNRNGGIEGCQTKYEDLIFRTVSLSASPYTSGEVGLFGH